jgi:CubicO group peptidase (beta-lactamase class C family)
MKRIISKCGVVASGLLLAASCQNPPDTDHAASPIYVEDPTESGFSQEGLDNIQGFIDAAVKQDTIPSAIAMIARDERIVWLGTAGDMEPGVPMRRDAIIPLASVGKMYTATAAMILYERGMISLDDPVSNYIPEFADVVVEVADESGATTLVEPESPPTIFHMLTHTGGIKSDGDAFWAARSAHAGKTTARDLARALAKLPLQSQPGERFSYGVTGSSYVVVAAIVETLSEQTLEEFMFENIFNPLGLRETFFYISDEKSSQLPAFYRKTDDGLQVQRALGEDFPRSTYFGSGGVMSSPQDILKFATIFLNGGESQGVRILKAETIAMMMRDQLGELASFQDPTMSWGFGAGVRMANRLTDQAQMQQYGWAGGNYAMLWVDPAQKLVGYFAFPLDPPGDLGLLLQYQQMVYGAVSEFYSNP